MDLTKPIKQEETFPVVINEHSLVEKSITQQLCKQWNGKSESCSIARLGIVDVVTRDAITEVKQASDWKHALGQILVYGHDPLFKNKQRRIYLYNHSPFPPDFCRLVESICSNYKVQVIWDGEVKTEEEWNKKRKQHFYNSPAKKSKPNPLKTIVDYDAIPNYTPDQIEQTKQKIISNDATNQDHLAMEEYFFHQHVMKSLDTRHKKIFQQIWMTKKRIVIYNLAKFVRKTDARTELEIEMAKKVFKIHTNNELLYYTLTKWLCEYLAIEHPHDTSKKIDRDKFR
jgi:hypothetical protein